jgi:hypothetical protein
MSDATQFYASQSHGVPAYGIRHSEGLGTSAVDNGVSLYAAVVPIIYGELGLRVLKLVAPSS